MFDVMKKVGCNLIVMRDKLSYARFNGLGFFGLAKQKEQFEHVRTAEEYV